VTRSIYVDVDDVLADATASLIVLARELFGRDVDYESCHSFDLGESFGLTSAQRDVLLDAAHEDLALESMRPVDGAAAILAEWRDTGHEVHIVTGRPPSTLPATRRWLARMRMPHSTIASVDKYGRQAHLVDAVPLRALAQRRFEVAIEDSIPMAQFLAEETGARVLLLDRPWNRDLSRLPAATQTKVQRVVSWVEIASLL